MAEAFEHPEPGADELSFDERFGLMVEKEWYAKKNARVSRLMRRSGFSVNASVENIEYMKGRNIAKKDVSMLASSVYIEQNLNIIISGKTGTGKSYLACALGSAACRHGYSCKYVRLPDLLLELSIARFENRYARLMESLRKVNLLIIDDVGLKPLERDESRDLLEIAESRYNRASMILSSQVPHGKWYELIPDPTIADAFMDRVVHNAFVIPLDSDISMREIMAQKKMKLIEIMEGGE
jgi:DNA replication protein DnaC